MVPVCNAADKLDNVPRLTRVRWHCRRGMLELDILLLLFVDTVYQTLSSSARSTFDRILAASDQTLHSWLFGSELPADAKMQDMVLFMRYLGQKKFFA